MKRKTAYKLAISALKEKQQKYSFDHRVYLLFEKAGQDFESVRSAHINYTRIGQAIKILGEEE